MRDKIILWGLAQICISNKLCVSCVSEKNACNVVFDLHFIDIPKYYKACFDYTIKNKCDPIL
jgi:hypothetical protein